MPDNESPRGDRDRQPAAGESAFEVDIPDDVERIPVDMIVDTSPRANLMHMAQTSVILVALERARITGAGELTLPYTVDTDTPFHPVDMPCHFEDGEVLSVAEYTPDVERELLLHMLEAANADPRGTADLIQSRPDKYAPWVGAINEARAAVGAVAGIFRPPAVGALTSALDGGHGISAADGR